MGWYGPQTGDCSCCSTPGPACWDTCNYPTTLTISGSSFGTGCTPANGADGSFALTFVPGLCNLSSALLSFSGCGGGTGYPQGTYFWDILLNFDTSDFFQYSFEITVTYIGSGGPLDRFTEIFLYIGVSETCPSGVKVLTLDSVTGPVDPPFFTPPTTLSLTFP